MTRQRKKLPNPNSQGNEETMETPAPSQLGRWLMGMGSAPTIFQHHPPAEIEGFKVTPNTRIQQKLQPLTFGSFLRQKFKPILQEIDNEEASNKVTETYTQQATLRMGDSLVHR
ncbi:hypothetical protein A4A49_62597, partial [Nicotiana attenuata]